MIMAPDAINYEDVARIDNNMLNSDGIWSQYMSVGSSMKLHDIRLFCTLTGLYKY